MSDGSRQDQFRVTVAVAGVNYGVFDAMSGGEGGSESLKYKPGAMGDEESQGGSQTRENITVSRQYRRGRDSLAYKVWDAQRGKSKAVVTRQPLDANKVAFGAPDVFKGTLLTVTGPEHDSTSSDAAMVELEVEAVGQIA